MKNPRFKIVDDWSTPLKRKSGRPVWNGPTRAERKAALAAEKAFGDAQTEAVIEETATANGGYKPRKTEMRLPPVWRPANREKADLLVSASSGSETDKKGVPSASLGGRSNGGQAPRKAARPEQADAAPGNASDCMSILERCRRNAARAAATEDEAGRSMEIALADIVRLKRLVAADPVARNELMQAYAAAGIRITKRTANQFTPMVKLACPEKMRKAATISRYASVLRLAEEENVRPKGFPDFVRQQGGLAACAARASQKRRGAAGGSRQAETAAEALKARRTNAPKLQLPAGLRLPKDGPLALLIEPGRNGSWVVLGCRRAPAGAVATSAPVNAPPASAEKAKRRR